MSDVPNHKTPMGVQAYRWLTVGCMAILTALSYRVLGQIDKTADKVDALQLQVVDMKGTLDSRINAHVQRLDTSDRRHDGHDRRNEAQDTKIDGLQQRVWRLPEVRTP